MGKKSGYESPLEKIAKINIAALIPIPVPPKQLNYLC